MYDMIVWLLSGVKPSAKYLARFKTKCYILCSDLYTFTKVQNLVWNVLHNNFIIFGCYTNTWWHRNNWNNFSWIFDLFDSNILLYLIQFDIIHEFTTVS